MMIQKNETELRAIVDSWAKSYSRGDVYGFGLSDEIDFPTFFHEDTRKIELVKDTHLEGFKAETHRRGQRVGSGFSVKAVFDNNPVIQGTLCNGHEVLAPTQIPQLGKIKVAIFPRRYYQIKRQLEEYGLKEYEDFIYYNYFVALFNYFQQDRILLWKATICITTRCSLQCEQCNMFMPHHKNPTDLPVETLIADIEFLFGRVDSIQWFGILGGEPLLYKKLNEYLVNIMKYSSRVGEFVIDTNGSVVPEDEMLQITKEIGNVRIMLNNYNINSSYDRIFRETVRQIKSRGISYTIRDYDWSKYRGVVMLDVEGELISHYIRCNQPFTAVQVKKLYTCHLPWSAARCGLGVDDPEDYFDFTDPTVTDLDIVKAGLGHLKRGYSSNCAMCNGCDPEYFEKIPKAQQIVR
jgi:hypothetical protein